DCSPRRISSEYRSFALPPPHVTDRLQLRTLSNGRSPRAILADRSRPFPARRATLVRILERVRADRASVVLTPWLCRVRFVLARAWNSFPSDGHRHSPSLCVRFEGRCAISPTPPEVDRCCCAIFLLTL